jgi:hypothetical protein
MITSSNIIGSVVALPVSTWLGSGPWGWESIFWVFGAVGVVWSVIWQIYGGSDPSNYSGISREELDLILRNNQKSDYRYGSFSNEGMNRSSEDAIEDSEIIQDNTRSSNPSHIPWGLILSRREVWAILGKI